MSQPVPRNLVFDDVVVDFAGRRLVRGGSEQSLEPKAFAVLAVLAGSPGRVFTRDEILEAVWGHRHVTQSVLNRIMSVLRQGLGEDAQHPRLLRTVYGIGYRFDLPEHALTIDGEAETAGPPTDPRPIQSPPLQAATPRSKRARWFVLAAIPTVLVLTISVLSWLPRKDAGSAASAPPDRVPAPSPQPSLAVLPFADLSQARDQEYLADGLAEEIINQLAQAPAMRVVGPASSFSFKGKNEDLSAVGRKLGVAYLLEGSVRKDRDHLRVTAQLVRAQDGTHLWSRTYASERRDIFKMQEEISRDVALALSVKLDVAKFNREQGGTTNVEAYERFLRWRNISMQERFDFSHDRERLQLAREMVALDPQCVLCWDALAGSLLSMAQEVGGVPAEKLRAEARQVRERIARIAPDSWVARRDRSNALWRQGKRAEAIALAKQVVDSGPMSKERVFDYAYMIYAMGHLDETVTLVEQVRALEPRALFLSRDLQFDYVAARRYGDAEAEYQRGRELEGSQLEPDYVAFFRQLAGKRPGGLHELRMLHRRLLGQSKEYDTPFFRDLGARLDDREAMLALVRKALADESYGGGADFAYLWTSVADALGEADLAVAALRKDLEAQKGFKEGSMEQFPYVAFWNAPYSSVRAHPDYKKLLVQAGVSGYWRQTGKWGDGCAPLGTDDFECR